MNNYIEIAYLISAVSFIYGLKMLSHPRTARNGNIIASDGMLIAIIATVTSPSSAGLNYKLILISMSIGSIIGAFFAIRVKMTQMPQLVAIFNPNTGAYKGLGGLIAIGNIFPGTWDWQSFWGTTAFLSIMLGILNVLPIPLLDGGHAMFLIYEMVSGRKPSDKFIEYFSVLGLIILLTLVLYANGNDIYKLFNIISF